MEAKATYMKEYMRKYNSNKIDCPCGATVSKGKYNNHLNTNRHIIFHLKDELSKHTNEFKGNDYNKV